MSSPLTVAFHSSLNYRGTADAVYNYADYNERILGNTSVITTPNSLNENHPEAVLRFVNRFEVLVYDSIKDLEVVCTNRKVDLIYIIKYGRNDGVCLKNTFTAIHCVYTVKEPHGDVYAGEMAGRGLSWCPHIVQISPLELDFFRSLPPRCGDGGSKPRKTLRKELGIPEDAIVFGRHGGPDTFNIEFVRDVMLVVVEKVKSVYFIFLTTPSILSGITHPRIIFLPTSTDPVYKRRFIESCDAMIHASYLGESFGLSIGEFGLCNKPVICFNGGWFNGEENQQHLRILREKALIYNNKTELYGILINFVEIKKKMEYSDTISRNGESSSWWDVYSQEYSPEKVMLQFYNTFIRPYLIRSV